MRILLIEDDPGLCDSLSYQLQEAGYVVDICQDGEDAFYYLEQKIYDLVLLDRMLSHTDGLTILKNMRARNDCTPVIFLTASGDECSVVTGLDMGADDYISKPFRPRELVSRIGACLRRNGKKQVLLEAGNVTVDTMKAVVKKDGEEIFLSVLEYRLLLILFQNKGMVLTRDKLLEAIWDMAGEFVEDNTLTVYMKRLREKIEDNPAKPEIIKTIRGMGYGVF